VLQTEAIIDIQEAFEWYEDQQAGLGFDLIDEIENGYMKITRHPLHYSAINIRFRKLKINRFPYLIIYEIEGDTIIINSFRHTRREPRN
jgi:hypothetical protein